MKTLRDHNAGEPVWTIGAVSRATGLSPHVIRVWQRRYGFPSPERKPSGHRLFRDSDVRRLRRIVQAVALGHRPGQVIQLPEARLEAILADAPPRQEPTVSFDPMTRLFDLVRQQRGEEITSTLLQDASLLGPLNFLEKRAIPLIERVGEAWAAGEIGVRHEHLFAERLEDVLRTLRLPFERAAAGPRVLLTTLPGEAHALGLQMAALVVALAGGRPEVLGPETPIAEIALAWQAGQHDAIGISVSAASGGPAAGAMLGALRRSLPPSVPIFAGGRGARPSTPPAGIEVVEDLGTIYDWCRRAGARRRAG